MSKKHNIITGIMMAGAMLAGGKEGNSQNTENTTKANITQVQHSTKNQIVDLNTLDHQKIITTEFNEIFKIYGKEKGLEIIKHHLVIEFNLMREKHGISPVYLNEELSGFSQGHADYLKKHKIMSHGDLEGRGPWTRSKIYGYECNALGEVCGANIRTISNIILLRTNSPTHKDVITENDPVSKKIWFTKVGIGINNGTIVVNFSD